MTDLSASDTDRRALVVYHRDAIEIVPLVAGVPVTVGRTWPSDVRARSRRLSRRHAAFELEDGAIWAEDLGSTNGTYVNGRRIEARTPIEAGDEISFASVTVSVHDRDEPWLRILQLDGHERFEPLVDAGIDRARRLGQPLSLLRVRARDPRGPRLGAWVPAIAGRLRPADRLALYGLDSVEILLPDTDVAQAETLAHTLVAALADVTGVSVGVASWPNDGQHAVRLGETARNAVMSTTPEHPVETGHDPGPAGPGRAQGPAGHGLEGGALGDPAMSALYRLVDRVAASSTPVLVGGETGTGKERVAREIHARSARRSSPLVKVDCAALPEHLLENELFGHERGAFPGAEQRRLGVFEEANGGTVLLDDIGELPATLQVALLRVLETGRIERVGGDAEIPIDVRVIAATHRNIEAMCDDGSFRWDLLYRLNVVTLVVPPLRERRGDIGAMVAGFVAESNAANGRTVLGLAPDVLPLLEHYRWPGNVRELRNTIDRAVVIAVGDRITIEDLPERLVAQVDLSRLPTEMAPGGTTDIDERSAQDLKERVRVLEIALLRAALGATAGDPDEAAVLLGLPRRALVGKLRTYGIHEGDPSARFPVEHDAEGRPLAWAERIARFERALIEESLARCGGDPVAASRLLNIQRRTLVQKLGRPLLPDDG